MKRTALLIGGVTLAATLGVAGVWLAWPPQAQAPRAAKAAETKPALALAPPAMPTTSIAVPEAAAPPEPTSSEFVRTGAPTTKEPPATAATEAAAAAPPASVDLTALAIDDLRARANADEIPAMEEMARRLVQGVGVPKDQQAGAGWLLRAAQHGSAQSAFNVGVMYERGFVVERDSTRAVEWYRKAADANLPMAKHQLALMLREGKGVARNGDEAIDLLRSASRQGMTASMFALADIYERGDIVPKDPAMALAWYAITAEFDHQTNRGGDNALAKTAAQRVDALQSTLLPGDLQRAQEAGQREFKQIVEALRPPKPPPLLPSALPPAALPAAALPAPALPALPPPPVAESEPDPPGWPKAANDQISAIQQALLDLKLLSDKPDGAIGPMTRAAIRAFQRSIGARETGEPTKDVFAALLGARRDVTAGAPQAPAAPAAPATIDLGTPEPPPAPPTSADIVHATPAPEVKTEPVKAEAAASAPAQPDPPKPPMPNVEAATPVSPPIVAASEQPTSAPAATAIDLGQPAPPPAPPTSADIARVNSDPWPTSTADQVTAIQGLLRDLNFSRDPPDGVYGPATRAAILDYERTAGLAQTGEPSKALFESLKEMRGTMMRKSPSSP